MPAKKRKYNGPDFYKDAIRDYCADHREELRKKLLQKFGYASMEDLMDAEYRMAFGFTCGWVIIVPRDPNMRKEWERDTYGGELFVSNSLSPAHNTQYVGLQRNILENALEGLGYTDMFRIVERLD